MVGPARASRPWGTYRAGRLSEAVGGEVWLKREDLTHYARGHARRGTSPML